MFENPRRGRLARNFITNVPKILDLKSSSEQIFFRKLSLGAPERGARLVFERDTICQWKVYERGPFSVKEWYKEYNFFFSIPGSRSCKFRKYSKAARIYAQLAKRVLTMKIANMVRKSLRQMTKANSANLAIIAKKKDDFLKLAVPKRLTLSKLQMKVEIILKLNEQPKRLKKNRKKKNKEKQI